MGREHGLHPAFCSAEPTPALLSLHLAVPQRLGCRRRCMSADQAENLLGQRPAGALNNTSAWASILTWLASPSRLVSRTISSDSSRRVVFCPLSFPPLLFLRWVVRLRERSARTHPLQSRTWKCRNTPILNAHAYICRQLPAPTLPSSDSGKRKSSVRLVRRLSAFSAPYSSKTTRHPAPHLALSSPPP